MWSIEEVVVGQPEGVLRTQLNAVYPQGLFSSMCLYVCWQYNAVEGLKKDPHKETKKVICLFLLLVVTQKYVSMQSLRCNICKLLGNNFPYGFKDCRSRKSTVIREKLNANTYTRKVGVKTV